VAEVQIRSSGTSSPLARSRQVAAGVDRVVGEQQERQLALAQRAEEAVRAGQGVGLVDQHPVHVHQP
jgi:hypothetical protein